LALDGYCPVQLTENEHWVWGDRRWGVIHEGRTYLFAGPDEQNRFLADPTKYAPVFSGDDVVKLVDEGKRMPGNRLHGAWFHGKVYLFVNESSYQQFDKNPFRYVSKLDAASATAQRPPLR
jgi:protein disulfide-isomerase